MLRNSSTIHQPNLFGTDLLVQLDPGHPCITIPWQEFEESFRLLHSGDRSTE
ncbi:hypothetical protein [Nitrosomonas sp. wSCUT-2]